MRPRDSRLTMDNAKDFVAAPQAGRASWVVPEAGRRDFRFCLIIFATLLFSYSFFYQKVWAPGNPNVTTRTALIISLLEDGSLSIDKFKGYTHDKALVNGHYYSDKAPGLALTALPVVAAARFVLKAAGVDVTTITEHGPTTIFYLFAEIATIVTAAFATACAAVAIYRVARRFGIGEAGAAFAAFGFGLATPAWGWATVFFGHMVAGSLMFVAFAILLSLEDRSLAAAQVGRRGFAVGAILAWAISVEFTAGPPCVLLALLGLSIARRPGGPGVARFVTGALIGGLVFLLPLLVYNKAAFASPFKIGYESVEGFEGMRQGFFGLTFPKPGVVASILFGPYRGLFWFSPILLASCWALAADMRLRRLPAVRATIVAIALYYVLLNGSYYYWDGGWSTAPRHLMPAVPFLSLPLAFVWEGAGSAGRGILGGLALLSAAIALVCTATTILSPTDYADPLFEYLLPRFVAGDIHTASLALGIHGLTGLLPVFAVWLAAAWMLGRLLRTRRVGAVQAGKALI